MSVIVAREEPLLGARIVARRSLRYAQVPPDYPRHVRAGSSLSWFLGKLAVVQDDTLLIGLIDVTSGEVDALDLPLRVDGQRTFDTQRGNKKHKPDFEASFSAGWEGAPALFALGSGSHENRETIAIVTREGHQLHTQLVHVPALYAALRAHPEFLSSELNIEGAVLVDGRMLRLFQRSNGRLAEGHTAATCATCELSWPELCTYLQAPERAAPPPIVHVRKYDLGRVGDGRLTFTDASLRVDGSILYSASAESSPNAYDDGLVTGSALGILAPDGSARYCLLRDREGQIAREKAEGLALADSDARRAYVVFDPDDHRAPAVLADVELSGF